MKRLSTLILLAIFLTGFAFGADRIITSYPTGGGAAGPSIATDEMKPVTSFGVKNGSAPSNPASGNVKLYSDTDGNIHILESDATDAELMRPDVATSTSAGLEVPTLDVTTYGLYGGSELATRYRQVVTVSGNALDNPDRDTIQGAIDLVNWYGDASATARYCILVMPGTYAEQSLELPDYVDLIGVSRDGCIISMTSTNYDNVDARTSALVSAPSNSLVANLTINNTRAIYPSVALNLGWGWAAGTTSGKSPRCVNCVLTGPMEDILYTSGNSTIIVSGCQVHSTGGGDVWSATGTSAAAIHRLENSYLGAEGAGSPACALWARTVGRVEINNCRVRADSSGVLRGAFRFEDTTGVNGTLVVSNSRIEGQAGALGNVLENQTTGAGWNVYLANTAYDLTNTVVGVTVATEDMGDGAKIMGGNLQVDGATGVTAANGFVVDANTKLESGSLTIGSGVILYPNGVNMTTDNPFSAASYATAGTERISETGEGKFVGLNTTVTQWRYFDALSEAQGDRVSSVVETSVGPGAGWYPDAATGAIYLAAVSDGMGLYFPIPYETGTVITRVAVRWQAVGNNDGVILTLQERVVTGIVTAWTTIGAAQTYTDAGTPFPVTPDIYDVADTTLADTKAYRIMIESQVATTGARLLDIGIETSKRAY